MQQGHASAKTATSYQGGENFPQNLAPLMQGAQPTFQQQPHQLNQMQAALSQCGGGPANQSIPGAFNVGNLASNFAAGNQRQSF